VSPRLRYRSLWGDWLFVWIVVLVVAAGVFTVWNAFDGSLDAVRRAPLDFLVAWVVNAVLFVVALAGIPIWWRWRRRTQADGSRTRGPRRPG
jgi:uncharacterized membrane protein YbhN (UPF0104 family)